MRLSQLEPQWLRWEGPSFTTFRRIEEKGQANGIMFVCPRCFAENNNQRPGVHSVICWAPGVPQEVFPNPGRWELVGSSFEDLTLVAGSSSVLLTGPGCAAHFFIRSGEIVGC